MTAVECKRELLDGPGSAACMWGGTGAACMATRAAGLRAQQAPSRSASVAPHAVGRPPRAPAAVIYVAEAAQALCRNADYEIPFLKKQASMALPTIDCMPTQLTHCGNSARMQGDVWR